MVKCICIDDKNRPAQIPASKWVEVKKEYHIIYVYWHPKQKLQGCDLAEIELSDCCKPFETFKINRFAIPLSEVENFVALCKSCTEMNDVNIKEAIDELVLEESLI